MSFLLLFSLVTSTLVANPSDTIHTVTLLPKKDSLSAKKDSLSTVLVKEIADARAVGELPIVEIGDPKICAPCVQLDHAMERPALVEAFKKVRVIKLSPVAWGLSLASFGFCSSTPDGSFTCSMPRFFAVKADGHVIGAGLDPDPVSPDAEKTATAVAPKFTQFFAPLR
jgi:hypothetical protein